MPQLLRANTGANPLYLFTDNTNRFVQFGKTDDVIYAPGLGPIVQDVVQLKDDQGRLFIMGPCFYQATTIGVMSFLHADITWDAKPAGSAAGDTVYIDFVNLNPFLLIFDRMTPVYGPGGFSVGNNDHVFVYQQLNSTDTRLVKSNFSNSTIEPLTIGEMQTSGRFLLTGFSFNRNPTVSPLPPTTLVS